VCLNLGSICAAPLPCRRKAQGQFQSEASALPWPALHPDPAADALNQTVGDGKPQTGADITRFRRKKWFENVRQIFLGDTAAGIFDGYRNGFRCGRSGGDVEPSAVGNDRKPVFVDVQSILL